MKTSFRGLVVSALLIVACGSGLNEDTTSGPPEGIPSGEVERKPPQGGAGGSTGSASKGKEAADGGAGGAPNDGYDAGVDGTPKDGGDGGASGVSDDVEEPTTLALENCDPSAPFDAPVAAFTGTMNADGLTFSANGLTAYISGKGTGNYEIYVATRNTLSEPFSTPTLLQGGINTAAEERAPTISPDGQTLYITSAPSGWRDIARSTRLGNGQFGPAQAITSPPGFNSSVHDQDP
ncbi:MAG TPA: hypothetical protein VMS65_12405, partial [Polyangiaceae bacterium]|nr:hypothetical protein [Polyangiaceae bacterium]